MKMELFDFSKNINKIDLYQHLCYYHNESNNSLRIIEENKQQAFLNFKEIYYLLKEEYCEYSKAKNYKYIHYNDLYVRYVSNITKAYVKLTKVNSYKNLNSNLYDIHDYIIKDFLDIFYIEEENIFDENKVDDFLGKMCSIKLKNYDIYVGKIDIVLNDCEFKKDEWISILFLGQCKKIKINDIYKIKIIEG